MLQLSNLRPPKGSRKSRKRVGRGPGSGHGKTSCRGQNGQNSRSGGGVPAWFTGGGFPLTQRLPKRGFTNIFRQTYQIVNVDSLERLSGDEVTPEALMQCGLIKNTRIPVKVLGMGEATRAFSVKDVSLSKSAREKISAAGGSVPEVTGK